MRKRTKEEADMQDLEFGFEDFKDGPDRLGWLVTYSAVTVVDVDTGAEVSGQLSSYCYGVQCACQQSVPDRHIMICRVV